MSEEAPAKARTRGAASGVPTAKAWLRHHALSQTVNVTQE